tara:strand:- start:2869 stop:3732 length:864 start_codon:yes stop_codon:yes gene_type:complete
MKKVFNSNSEVIHLFAQRSQSEAMTSNRNVYFETPYNSGKEYGTKLYSYGSHYLLAEFIDNNTVVINDSGYSVSTSKHISIAYGATRQYKQFSKTRIDLDLVYNTVIANKNKLARANKPDLYINPILSLWDSLNEFLEFSKAKKYKSNSKYKEIKAIVNALNNGSDDFNEKLRLSSIRAEKAQKTKDAKELKIKLVKFNAYEVDSFRIGKEDYLRISKDGQNIETTQRVRVNIESAKMLYKLILANVEIKGHRIDGYTVTSINGTLKIGCHNINMASVNTVGKQILS